MTLLQASRNPESPRPERGIDKLGAAQTIQPLRGRAGRGRWIRRSPWTKQVACAFRRHAQRGDHPVAATDQGARRESATQFHHVIDIAPTILEVVGVPYPAQLNGEAQK